MTWRMICYNALPAFLITVSRTRQNNGQRVREYDLSGNTTLMTNYGGETTDYQYDALNRLTAITYPDSKTVAYAYDAVGQMLTATNETGTVRSHMTTAGACRVKRMYVEKLLCGSNTCYDYLPIGRI
jgi:YD repeat-containing protein